MDSTYTYYQEDTAAETMETGDDAPWTVVGKDGRKRAYPEAALTSPNTRPIQSDHRAEVTADTVTDKPA